jgi:hypothetical protein
MISIRTRLEEDVLKEIEKMAKEMNLERGALIRKFILDGYQKAILKRNLELVHRGELSIGQGAEDSGVSIYEFLEAARESNLEIGPDESTIPYEVDVLKRLHSKMTKIN